MQKLPQHLHARREPGTRQAGGPRPRRQHRLQHRLRREEPLAGHGKDPHASAVLHHAPHLGIGVYRGAVPPGLGELPRRRPSRRSGAALEHGPLRPAVDVQTGHLPQRHAISEHNWAGHRVCPLQYAEEFNLERREVKRFTDAAVGAHRRLTGHQKQAERTLDLSDLADSSTRQRRDGVSEQSQAGRAASDWAVARLTPISASMRESIAPSSRRVSRRRLACTSHRHARPATRSRVRVVEGVCRTVADMTGSFVGETNMAFPTTSWKRIALMW